MLSSLLSERFRGEEEEEEVSGERSGFRRLGVLALRTGGYEGVVWGEEGGRGGRGGVGR